MQPRDFPAQVYFAQSEFVVDEADGEVVVSVVMFNAPDTAVMLTVLVSDGTATSSNDYTYDSSMASLSFDSFSAVDLLTTATFTIPIIDDNTFEDTETIALSLDADTLPSGVTLVEPNTATVLILDDDDDISDDGPTNDMDNDGLIEVNTVEQLNAIRYDLDGDGKPSTADAADYFAEGAFGPYGEDTSGIPCRGYELTVNLQLNHGWEPIGNSSDPYTAIFEGNGNVMSNLNIIRDDLDFIGFFGVIGASAIICNVGLESVVVRGNAVASLAGRNEGTIISSYALVETADGSGNVGGLVGENEGTITASYTQRVGGRPSNVRGEGIVGGLVGINEGTITASYVNQRVGGNDYAGGLVGRNNGTITSSYAMGSVVGVDYVGGLAGFNAGNITSSYSTATVTGFPNLQTTLLGENVGGLVGAFDNSPTNSYYYAGATVMKDEFARSASFLSVLSASSAGWDEPVDVDGDPATTHDQYMPWVFRNANYEYPVLRPAPRGATSATWEDFGTQFHAHVVCFDVERDTVEEPSGTRIVRRMGVTMYNAPTGGTASVRVLGHADSTATNGVDSDFPLAGVQLDFDYDTQTSSVSFTNHFLFFVNPDDEPEGDETIVLALVDPSPDVTLGNPSLTTVTILANDLHWEVSFSPGDSTTTVPEGGGSPVSFVVELDYPAVHELVIPIVVDGALTTAISAADYILPSPSVTFYEGETRKDYEVTIEDDDLVENDEFVEFIFGILPDDVMASTDTDSSAHRLEITDNDKYVVSFVGAGAGTVAEGEGPVNVEVSISPTPSAGAISPVTIPIVVSDVSTATLADDYILPDSSSVTFNADDTSTNYVVTIVDDALAEAPESVMFTFGELPGYVMMGGGTTAMYRLAVTDNDGYRVEFSVAAGTVAEDAEAVNVEVSISPPPNDVLEIPIIVSASTLTKGDDCTYDSFVHFNAGHGRSSFNVYIMDDVEVENDEYVEFTFDTSGLPVVLGDQVTCLLTVTDNDGYRVSFDTASQTVDEGVGTVNVGVSITPTPDESIVVPITVDSNASLAVLGSDYALPTLSSVTFDALTTAVDFVVTITDDRTPGEIDETIVLIFDVGSLANVLAGSPDRSTITITDNEPPLPPEFLYDTDNDGLIAVTTVEQLNAIRCDLDGDGEIDDLTSADPSVPGSKAAAYVAAFHGVCPSNDVSYRGYELDKDLDFKKGSESTDGYSIWAEGSTAPDNVPEGWLPIGRVPIGRSNSFIGTFDGNGHTITGLYINRPNYEGIGLFVGVLEDGIICNVGLEEVSVLGLRWVGGLVGIGNGTITSSYVMGSVAGDGHVGGLVGISDGTITSSYAMGSVTGSSDYVGGLAGYNSGTIQSSYAMGSVMGADYVGGLVGQNESIITSSYATGMVTGAFFVGGLVGRTSGDITSSYATGSVTGSGGNVGGLMGRSPNNPPTNSYYYAGATVMAGGAPVDPDEFARSASFLSALSASSAGWDELVDVDGDPATTHDQYMPWVFRNANYEYPVLRPAPRGATSATWEEFGTQFHAPVVCFDAERDMVEEPSSTPIVRQMGVTMYNAPTGGTASVKVSEDVSSTATNGVDCDFPLAGVQLDFGYDTQTSSVSFTNSISVTVNPDDRIRGR